MVGGRVSEFPCGLRSPYYRKKHDLAKDYGHLQLELKVDVKLLDTG